MLRLFPWLLLLFIETTQCADDTLSHARLMIVHSYEQDHVCGRPQAEGAIAALRDRGWKVGENLEVESYFMDTKRTHTSPQAINHQGELALARIKAFRPQIVLVLDDNAIQEVMLPLVGRTDIAIVFSGMNAQPEDYNRKKHFLESWKRPGSNVTGVYEKLHVVKSLAVIGAALSGFSPGDKVVGITDYTPTGNAITRQFAMEIEQSPPNVTWEVHRVKNFSEYQALIRELGRDRRVRAIYPAALSLKSSSGKTVTAPEIFAWTVAHNRKPEMALNYYFSKTGLFGGAAVDFSMMGYAAGDKIAKILSGIPVGTLPIEAAADYAIVFNHKRALDLGVTIPEALLTAADHVYRK